MYIDCHYNKMLSIANSTQFVSKTSKETPQSDNQAFIPFNVCEAACIPYQLFTQIRLQDRSLHLNLLASQSGYGSANQKFALVLEYCWRWTMKFSGSGLTKQIYIRKIFTWMSLSCIGNTNPAVLLTLQRETWR